MFCVKWAKVAVRSDTCAIVYDDDKIEQLEVEGKAVKREAVGVVIYSDLDFDAFYNKHCKRMPNDNNPFTVMVVDDVNIPSKEEVKAILEEVLRERSCKLKKGLVENG